MRTKWYRVLLAVLALGLVTCSNPAAPRYPDPDEDPPPDPTDPGQSQGFHFEPGAEITFLV